MSQVLTQHFQTHSQVRNTGAETDILLATPLQAHQVASFFRGRVQSPLLFRDGLLWLSEIVASRFYRPDLWRHLDPVVTCDSHAVRLECFSSCAGVYGRLDLDSPFFQGETCLTRGSTNVNFHPGFLHSLNLLRPEQETIFEVGSQFMAVHTPAGEAIEHKVKLPERWLRGFLQSQALLRKATHWQHVPTLAARQFLLQLKSSDTHDQWLIMRGKQLQCLSSAPPVAAAFPCLPISGLHRLGLFRRLLSHVQALDIYQTQPGGPTVWVAHLPHARATLALSGSVQKGFSGEGEALRSLSATTDPQRLQGLRDVISLLGDFDLAGISELLALPTREVLPLIDTLATEGLLGYDNANARYFYRVLPFATARRGRLEHAKDLLQAGQVELEEVLRLPGGYTARGWVRGQGAEYRVELALQAGYLSQGLCHCPWIQQHGLQRGPCKHLLALRFALEAHCEAHCEAHFEAHFETLSGDVVQDTRQVAVNGGPDVSPLA